MLGMGEKEKYRFEIFEAPHSEFQSKFTDYLNQLDKDGWEYEDCKFISEADSCKAMCVFERD